MKFIHTVLLVATMLAGAAQAQSTMSGSGSISMGDAQKEAAKPATDFADGEIRKIDKETKKITIKHGEIKNLDMPGMTMVFQVKDAAMLNGVQAGDKIRFKAESSGGALVVTEIRPVK